MKKVFWAAIIALTAGMVWWFSQDAFLPDSTIVSPVAVFEGPKGQKDRIQKDLADELRKNSVVIWGQWPDDMVSLEALEEFLKATPASEVAGVVSPSVATYSQVWVDDQFHERFPSGRKVYLRGQEDAIANDVGEVLAKGEKLLILTSPIFAASMLKGTPAFALGQSKIDFISLLILDGARQREQEADLKIPCVLPHGDRTGTGALGCTLLQSSRSAYRKVFPAGSRVLQIEKLNTHDYLILRSQEVAHDN